MSPDEPRGPSPAPPPPPDASGSMTTGGIYIRWRDRLWQEQPDGSYLLWNDDTRQWEKSSVQPPAEPGRTVATQECPNCGKRVKARLRSCPHCEHPLVAPQRERAPVPEEREAARGDGRQRRRAPVIVALAVLLVIGVPAGLFRYRQNELCARWKAGVRAVTETTIDLKGLPPGLTEAELYTLNESRMADQRPGGCG